jgi:hypothetical protein
MEADECESSDDCDGDEVCVAPYDSEADPKRGQAVCVSDCVEALEVDKYCFDDEACCEGLECQPDGLCEPPFEGSGGETGEMGTTGGEMGTTGGEMGTTGGMGTTG